MTTIKGKISRTAHTSPARTLFWTVAHFLRDRRQYRDLSELSDDMLRDIGLTRADVNRAVREHRLL